jgi:hypothetical protein
MSDLSGLSTLQLQRLLDSKHLSEAQRVEYLDELNSRASISSLNGGVSNRYLHKANSSKSASIEDFDVMEPPSIKQPPMTNYEKMLHLKELSAKFVDDERDEEHIAVYDMNQHNFWKYVGYTIVIVFIGVVVAGAFLLNYN